MTRSVGWFMKWAKSKPFEVTAVIGDSSRSEVGFTGQLFKATFVLHLEPARKECP
jgi:hypothetical protein